ncbi:hypothetical protein SGPA1_11884 [Streptomyces misionensis JCM 4497]
MQGRHRVRRGAAAAGRRHVRQPAHRRGRGARRQPDRRRPEGLRLRLPGRRGRPARRRGVQPEARRAARGAAPAGRQQRGLPVGARRLRRARASRLRRGDRPGRAGQPDQGPRHRVLRTVFAARDRPPLRLPLHRPAVQAGPQGRAAADGRERAALPRGRQRLATVGPLGARPGPPRPGALLPALLRSPARRTGTRFRCRR